jgi:deoxyadenosine/deoxycytidine kinase
MKVVIDGNIGSGKTTQLDMLESAGWTVKREPIDDWPLEQFYKDPKTWGFVFQMVVLQTLQPLGGHADVVYERCIYSTRDVFWRHMSKSVFGSDPLASQIYLREVDRYMWHPDIYIFLAKDVDVAWKHIQQRGQTGDFGVTYEYLQELDIMYAEMIGKIPCPVYVIDANRSVEEIHADITRLLEQKILAPEE